MKYFLLVWVQLFCSCMCMLLILFLVVVVFLLFGMFDLVCVVFLLGGSVEGVNCLVVVLWLLIIQLLLICLEVQVCQVVGVCDVVYGMWFGGIYQDLKNFFLNFLVLFNYFDVYCELQIDLVQLEDWKQICIGVIVGEILVKQFGWKIGDIILLQVMIFLCGGSNDWLLVFKGIYCFKDCVLVVNEECQLMMNWKYFDEFNDYIKNQVSWYMVMLDNLDYFLWVVQVIDVILVNFDYEIKIQIEFVFQQVFVKQFVDIGMIVILIMGVVFFILLLLIGNIMV